MTIYEKNLEVLARHYPYMDELIEKAKKENEDRTVATEEFAGDGTAILKVKTEDGECYLNGKRNPIEPAQIWYQGLGELETNATIFVMGVGNATYLKELVEQTEKKIIIIVYEPSIQIFLYFLEHTPLEQWMERHTIAFWVEGLEDMDEEHMEEFLNSVIRYAMLSYNHTLIVPNYDILFSQKSVAFMKLCKKVMLQKMVQHNTKITFSDVLVKNILSNLPYLCDGYKTTQLIEVIPRDIPGIVVAAGPSLNKNVQDLKAAKGKAFIIAVDSAIKPLLNAGIIPDMFVCIDGVKPLHLIEREEAKEIPLLTGIDAASEVLAYHTGKKFFYNQGFSVAERILLKSESAIGGIESGGSVATNAYSLLHKIGIMRIILVGQDLAMTGNKTHADGSFEEKMPEIDTSKYLMVKGNEEDEVPTRLDMKQYIDWYDMYIAGCQKRKPGFRVINATEGGAYLQNTEVMTLKEAIEKECTKPVDIAECLDRLSPMLSKENQKWSIKYLRGLPEEFEATKKQAKNLRQQYQKLAKICKKKNIDKKEYLNILKKIEKEINNLETQSTYQLVRFTLITAEYILQREEYLSNDTLQEEGKEIARKGILYMEKIMECTELLKLMAEELYIKSDRLNILEAALAQKED